MEFGICNTVHMNIKIRKQFVRLCTQILAKET